MAMKITQLDNGVVEYDTGKAIVRIHPGKLNEEERKEKLKNATETFCKAAYKDLEKAGKLAVLFGSSVPVHSDGSYSM